MGKSSRNKIKKMNNKNKNKNFNEKSPIAEASASNTPDVKILGQKATTDSKRSTDKIHDAEDKQQFVAKSTNDEIRVHKRTVDTKVAMKSSSDPEECMLAKIVLDEMEKAVTKYKRDYELNSKSVAEDISSTQYQDKTDSILDIYRGLDTFLKFRYPLVFVNTKKQIVLHSEEIERLWNIFYLPIGVSKPEAKEKAYQVSRVLKAVREAADAQTTATIATEEDNIKTTTDSRSNDSDSWVHVIKKPMQIPQKFTVIKKGEKEDSISTVNVQGTGKRVDDTESECDAGTPMENKYGIDETSGGTDDGSEMKQSNERVNLSPSQIESSDNSNQEFQRDLNNCLKLQQSKSEEDLETPTSFDSIMNMSMDAKNHQIAQGETEERNAEASEIINALKENAVIFDSLIGEVEKVVEDYCEKRAECEGSTDNNGAVEFPLNATEETNERKKGNNDTDTYNGDIRNAHFNKDMLTPKLEIEECSVKDKYEIKSHERKILPVNDYNTSLDEFTSEQNFNLDEHRDMESEVLFSEKKRDNFCSKEGHIAAAEKTASLEKIRNSKDVTDEKIEETVAAAKSEETPPDVVKLEKNDSVYFQLEANNKKTFHSGNTSYFLKEGQNIKFNFEDENIQLYFTDNHILVSTENSEFEFSFQKMDHVYLTNTATQTDTLV